MSSNANLNDYSIGAQSFSFPKHSEYRFSKHPVEMHWPNSHPKKVLGECPTCMISNTGDVPNCEACETPNPNTVLLLSKVQNKVFQSILKLVIQLTFDDCGNLSFNDSDSQSQLNVPTRFFTSFKVLVKKISSRSVSLCTSVEQYHSGPPL